MTGIDSILCVVDPTVPSGGAAIDKAAILAHAFDAALELLICSVPPLGVDQDTALSRRLDELAEPLRARCPDISTRLIIGDTLHRSLLDYIQDSSFDLVVKDTHPHAFVQRAFGTSTDWHLVRACAPPLLLTHPSPWKPRPVILACIDPTHPRDPGAILDHCVLQGAQALSSRLHGALHALHTYRHDVPAMIADGEALAAVLSCEGEEDETIMRLTRIGELVEDFGVASNRMHLCAGRVREGIVRTAGEQRADIVVMGALSRAKPLAALVGCEANHVLDRLRCDVMVVKVPEFVEKWAAHQPLSPVFHGDLS